MPPRGMPVKSVLKTLGDGKAPGINVHGFAKAFNKTRERSINPDRSITFAVRDGNGAIKHITSVKGKERGATPEEIRRFNEIQRKQ